MKATIPLCMCEQFLWFKANECTTDYTLHFFGSASHWHVAESMRSTTRFYLIFLYWLILSTVPGMKYAIYGSLPTPVSLSHTHRCGFHSAPSFLWRGGEKPPPSPLCVLQLPLCKQFCPVSACADAVLHAFLPLPLLHLLLSVLLSILCPPTSSMWPTFGPPSCAGCVVLSPYGHCISISGNGSQAFLASSTSTMAVTHILPGQPCDG